MADLHDPDYDFPDALISLGAEVGKVTSAVYSPRLEKNIALAMVSADFAYLGTELEVVTASGPTRAP